MPRPLCPARLLESIDSTSMERTNIAGADGFQTGCRKECTKLLSIHVTILINPDVSNEAGGTFTHKTFASNSAVRSHLTLGFLLARIKKMLFYRDVKSERVRVTKPVKTCLRQF